MEDINVFIDYTTKAIELIGISIIFVGTVYAIISFLLSLRKANAKSYIDLRQSLGKSILLGLEILIAADIMETVTTEPTLTSVLVLGIVVLIRTFLSMSLEIELEGRLPWKKLKNNN